MSAEKKKRATRDSQVTKDQRKAEPPELEAEDNAERVASNPFRAADAPSYQPANPGNPTGMPRPENPEEQKGPHQRR